MTPARKSMRYSVGYCAGDGRELKISLKQGFAYKQIIREIIPGSAEKR